MLPKKRKVGKEFFKNNLERKGEIYHSKHFSIRIIKNSSVEDTLFSVVISKKTVKLAVSRNKFKRRVYNIIKLCLNEVKPNYIAIIYLKKEINSLSSTDFKDEFLNLLYKTNILEKRPNLS